MLVLTSLSRLIARTETVIGSALGALVTILILLNVITRSLGAPLFWVDEAAVSAMVWMAFLGASIALHRKESVAVTILSDSLGARTARILDKLVDVVVLSFTVILLVLSWQWFAPISLARHGFDYDAFSASSFNYIYTETTTTLGIPKFWLWLIVPVFAVNATIHGFANLFTQSVHVRETATTTAAQ